MSVGAAQVEFFQQASQLLSGIWSSAVNWEGKAGKSNLSVIMCMP